MTSDICTTDFATVDVVLMFHAVPSRAGLFWRLLKPGFGHVQTWTLVGGRWVQIDGCLEALFVNSYMQPPWELLSKEELQKYSPTFLPIRRTVRIGTVREPFHFGPITCVDLTKAVLGIRAPFVRTPWQLYKHLLKEPR